MKPIILFLWALAVLNCKSNKEMTYKADDITVQIEISPTISQVGDEVVLSFSVQNNTASDFEFCYWHTPLEKEFTANFLEITHNGKVLPYRGKMVKRRPPTKKDMIRLRPTEAIAQKISVNEGYSLNKEGTYKIQFKGHSRLPNSNVIGFSLRK